MRAVVCPVCNGEGQVCVGMNRESTSVGPMLRNCHGCNGKGWVVIPEYTLTLKPGVDSNLNARLPGF